MTRMITILVLAAGLALAACGESEGEKAQKQVCHARADIKKQIDELSSLTVSTVTLEGVQANVTAIGKDLQQMADAQGQLSGDRKQQVQQANATFKSDLTNIVNNVLKSTSVSEAKQQLKSSVQQLAASYEKALAPIDCS